MGGRFQDAVVIHDEVSNGLVLADTASGACLKIQMGSDVLESVKELTKKFTGLKGKAPVQFTRYFF